ncbi:FecR family protein [Pedobacter frigoris]|uniref:FecR family protein n=1 Tax=Pedobacter frigoris TaxID=2571272 RepID=UPI002930C7C8|nr:FecR domain-containing protein [Pedobacter frigoris]
MTKESFLELLEKVESGTATLEEVSAYNQFYKHFQTDNNWNCDEMGEQQEIGRLMHEHISKAIAAPVKKINVFYFAKYAAAAVAVITVAIAIYFFNLRKQTLPVESSTSLSAVKDVPAGGNKAILTLANGKKISLTDAANGNLLTQSGIAVTKTADGQLVYKASGKSGVGTESEYNVIATPRGGQYQILLSDGSKVWLNAASSLRFPAEFTGTERNVELTGEGYFEISKNKKMPFNVIANGTKVAVLGTHFNVMAYTDAGGVKTTLLEGSVKLSSGQSTALLEPGQQGVANSRGAFDVSDADIESAVAWKNGYFMFNNSDLQNVMSQLSRWYDVDVVFENKGKEHEFVGEINRNYSLVKVLKILELSDIKFELKGRTLIVK